MDSSLKAVLGSYEWIVPNFAGSAGRLQSSTFDVGGYSWRLLFFPKGNNTANNDHVSFFLSYADANNPPPGSLQCPGAAFSLRIKNDRGRELDYVRRDGCSFSSERVDWGFSRFIELDKLSANSGFLTADGSIVLHVDVMVENPRLPSSSTDNPKRPDPRHACLADEFLALLDDPDSTSDLTVIVGGGSGSAAAGVNADSGSDGSGGSASTGEAAAPSGGQPQRSFHVHRAVLAARCPFFRTLFNAGMADSAAQELPLPDADPDAFAVLLRYMYGGEVPHCERAVHRAAIPLCDTLLLPQVKETLERRLVETAGAETIIGDLLWAAGHGREEVFEQLVAVYKQVAKDVDPAQVVAMAAANPALMPRLLIGVTQQGPVQQQGEVQPPGKGAKGKGGRKRARAWGCRTGPHGGRSVWGYHACCRAQVWACPGGYGGLQPACGSSSRGGGGVGNKASSRRGSRRGSRVRVGPRWQWRWPTGSW